MVYFIATTFLASIWADIGFKVWQNLYWFYAVGIWVLYLGPVLLGYYLGGILDKLQTELKFLVDKNLGLQPSILEIREKKDVLLNGLLKNNAEYKRLWWEFLTFVILMFSDIFLGIWLYKSKVLT